MTIGNRLTEWLSGTARLVVRLFQALTETRDFFTHEGNVYVDYPMEKILGVDRSVDPTRVYMYSNDRVSGTGAIASFNYDGFIAYDFGRWGEEVPNSYTSNVEDMINVLVETELHELTHWGVEGQKYGYEQTYAHHSARWNPVLREVRRYLDEDDDRVDMSTESLVDPDINDRLAEETAESLIVSGMSPEKILDELGTIGDVAITNNENDN